MGLFGSIIKLGLKTVTLPVTVAADVASSGTVNLFREANSPGSTRTPLASLDHAASIVDSVKDVAKKTSKALDDL